MIGMSQATFGFHRSSHAVCGVDKIPQPVATELQSELPAIGQSIECATVSNVICN